MFNIKRTHLGTFWISWCSWSPHLIGEIIELLCWHVGWAGLLVGGRGKVGAVMIGALVQLGRCIAIFWSVGGDCHGFGLYPHHDWLSLKHSNLFTQVPVGLEKRRDSLTNFDFKSYKLHNVWQMFNSLPVALSPILMKVPNMETKALL